MLLEGICNSPRLERSSTELMYKIDKSLQIQRIRKQAISVICSDLLLNESDRYV